MVIDPPLIVLDQIFKSRRGGGGHETMILRGIDLAVSRSRMTVIIGPSGGGKTTLVRLINRLEEPTSGRILLDGRDISELDPLDLRRRVALVPQKPFLFPGTVLDNLRQAFYLRGTRPPAANDSDFAQVLEENQIPGDWLQREGRSLSLGQQQRVCLARSLAAGPEALLLDEPTSALDRPTGDRLAETLRHIARSRELALLMVTHDLRLAERAADDLAYLENGRIEEQGEPGRLLNRPASKALQAFLREPQMGADHER
ncbi:MAG: ATP-binding cassette domain-containing protein [Syntrophotaleaceae bacterium]